MSLCCAAILAAGTARDMWAALCATLCGEGEEEERYADTYF
jgi:hypothetical protein